MSSFSLRSLLLLLPLALVAAHCGPEPGEPGEPGGCAPGEYLCAADTLTVCGQTRGSFEVVKVCRPGSCKGGRGTFSCDSCPDNLSACGSVCTSVADDPKNCGACGKTCPSTQICSGGVCGCAGSVSDNCGGVCVNVAVDPRNCGACGKVCPSAQACIGGECRCSGETPDDCSGGCVDFSSNRNNCGACGVACGSKEVCENGGCALPPCPDKTPQRCGEECVNLDSDLAHCGACDKGCGEASCQGGTCICAVGELCGGKCLDTQNDPANCGACGGACESGVLCVAGACKPAPPAKSCPDLPKTCAGDADCCEQLVVPAESGFLMGSGDLNAAPGSGDCIGGLPASAAEVPEHAVVVGSFRLDRFEVTVGRFRKYIDQYSGPSVPEGAGAHPKVPGSGWRVEWNALLPKNKEELGAFVKIGGGGQGNDNLPVNYATWYEAFAFCVQDGGRLPTEAEWEFAAAGGKEDRLFPWPSAVDPATGALPSADGFAAFASPGELKPVGSFPKGAGRWGHMDLGGSLFEMVFDLYDADWYKNMSACNDCANATSGKERVMKGGAFASPPNFLRAAHRNSADPAARDGTVGFRCASDL